MPCLCIAGLLVIYNVHISSTTCIYTPYCNHKTCDLHTLFCGLSSTNLTVAAASDASIVLFCPALLYCQFDYFFCLLNFQHQNPDVVSWVFQYYCQPSV